jgi:hypothetical protein
VVEATQSSVARALKRWASLRAKKERIEAEREQKLAPIKARFERSCAPILARTQRNLAPVEAEIATLEAEMGAAMLAGIEKKGGIRVTRISTATAIIEVVTKSEREIDTQAFFNAIPPAQRNAAFWSCLKTLVGKAEKFLGARINEFAHAKQSHRVEIRHEG